jgi:hypothetical protein
MQVLSPGMPGDGNGRVRLPRTSLLRCSKHRAGQGQGSLEKLIPIHLRTPGPQHGDSGFSSIMCNINKGDKAKNKEADTITGKWICVPLDGKAAQREGQEGRLARKQEGLRNGAGGQCPE